MPTSRKKPGSRSQVKASGGTNGVVSDVLTLAEAAAYLRLSEAEVVTLFHSQNLPGRCTGSDWRFLKSALQQWLSTGAPTPQSRKAAQLALAGKYRDDPELMGICDEAYRQRGRPMREAELPGS